MSTTRRRSMGGSVVESGLSAAGFGRASEVALVETSQPGAARYRAVLAQNAWNVMPIHRFWKLMDPYPMRMKARMLARRAVAQVNLRRADQVVCLTDAMSGLVHESTGVSSVVAPVCLPLDMLKTSVPAKCHIEPYVLVPGTMTWFKNPFGAIEEVASNSGLPRLIVFAGTVDRSGCWRRVQNLGMSLGVECKARPLDRVQMVGALTHASAVLLPSDLESLGFSLAEALCFSRHVKASAIPAHKEVARRLGRQPDWFGAHEPHSSEPIRPDPTEILAQWTALGETLGLPTAPKQPN